MSVVGFIRRALAMGVDPETALRMGEAFEAEMPVFVPAQKSKAALRTEKWRASKASPTVTEPSPTVTANTVTDRHEASPRDGCDASPPAHVRDNLSRLVDTGTNYTSPKRERDFKTRADLDWLQAELREAGGPALANMAIAPGMADLSPIIGLLSKGSGPPCDLEADVLPTIQARCAGRKAGSIKSWAFFRDPIREARDRRLTGAPAMADVVPIARGQGPPSITERIGSEIAEARRKALEQLSAKNG